LYAVGQNRKKNTATRELVVNRKKLCTLKTQKQELVGNGILENNIIIEVGSATNEIKIDQVSELDSNILKEVIH
jgi:hypothetical protein